MDRNYRGGLLRDRWRRSPGIVKNFTRIDQKLNYSDRNYDRALGEGPGVEISFKLVVIERILCFTRDF